MSKNFLLFFNRIYPSFNKGQTSQQRLQIKSFLNKQEESQVTSLVCQSEGFEPAAIRLHKEDFHSEASNRLRIPGQTQGSR